MLSFFSDDHGQTWKRSRVVPHEGKMAWASESKVAELPDGNIGLFYEADGYREIRLVRFSLDWLLP